MTPRIVQLGKYYPPYRGGIENNTLAVSRALSDMGEVSAAVFHQRMWSRTGNWEGVPVLRCGSLGLVRSAEMSPAAFTRIRRLSADLWYIHLPNPVMVAAFQAARRRGKVILSWHNDILRQKWLARLLHPSLEAMVKRADRIVVYTRNYIDYSPLLRRHRDKCVIIPHGTDPDILVLDDRAAAEKKRLPVPESETILFVGRLVWYKGLDPLIRAMVRMDRGRLVILGDGPMRGPMTDLAARLGLGDRVRFEGAVSHARKVAWLHHCRFVAMPSTDPAEGFGQTQVEAHLCGRPVVSCDIPSGVPHVNPHGVTGLLVPPADPDALAEAMTTLLTDDALRERLGRRARDRAMAEFSYPVFRRRTRALCRELTGGGFRPERRR